MTMLEQLRAYLAAINPALPALALVFCLWAPQAAIRRWLPALWAVPASWGPQAQELRRVWQALPSLAGGALMGALSANMDPWQAVTGAVLGALAPFWHHALKASPLPYEGQLGSKPNDDDKTPPTGTKPVGLVGCLAFLLLTGCSNLKPPTSAESYKAARDFCAAYPSLPAELHNKADDEACAQVSKVCTDTTPEPAEGAGQ